MKTPTPLTAKTGRLSLLCLHLEALCQQAISLIEGDDTEALGPLETRKAVVLQEFITLLGPQPGPVHLEMARRVQQAVNAQLLAATAAAAALSARLNECRSAAQRAGQVRNSYARKPATHSAARGPHILACG